MKWTDEDIQYLIANYPIKDNKGIAEQLDRSIGSVASKGWELNLKKDPTFLAKLRSKCRESREPGWLEKYKAEKIDKA